jgi:chemotaxis protein methyltransferase WspC
MTQAQSMLRTATGLNLSKPVVDRAIKTRMEQTSSTDRDAYLAAMTPGELTALVELVVVPESWFYRDQQAFHAALDFVRQRQSRGSPLGSSNAGASAGRAVRILSIPCAGGEEPYTMAMVLSDAGVPHDSFIIDAYDISPACIERARGGIYGRNAFRSGDMAFRDRHFSSAGDDDYRISDAIRKQVRFRQGNLLELDLSTRLGYYDVVFCRNLLIYFDKPTTRAAIERLEAMLSNDGLLFAGYAEVPSFCQHGFAPLKYAQAFGLQKEAAARANPAAAPRIASATTSAAARRAAAPPRPAAPPTLPTLPTPTTRLARAITTPLASAAPLTLKARPAATASSADLLAQARKLADQGQLQQADSKCREHLALAPDSAEAYFILGLLNEHAQKPALAEDYWRRCIYLQPDHYDALCHLALLAETNGDPAAAAALKARAARIYKRQQAS